MRYARRPRASTDTPITRPGICRAQARRVAKNAACGPPPPGGTPKRCALPTTTSAPISPGGVASVRASRSEAATTSAPAACAQAVTGPRSSRRPNASGDCASTPNRSSGPPPPCAAAPRSVTSTRMPSGSARPRTTATVWGKQSAETRKRRASGRRRACSRNSIVIASAAAVASSSRDALAISIPVRSATAVWKFSNASRRPCATSAWYGVYGVYQPGFSSRLRRITGGVTQPW